jgi:26S proteasome regulatory subunit N3
MKIDAPAEKGKESRKIIPEGDAYIKMLTQLVLLDSGRLEEAAEFSTSLVEEIHAQNRRTLDQIGAKIFFYYSRAYELLGDLSSIRPYFSSPSFFLPHSFALSNLSQIYAFGAADSDSAL